MRVTVPTSLAGGSLLDAHKWVKTQMARTNPGGSADYTLRSIDGSSLTLSDLVRGNPGHELTVEIVMAGYGGVRSNPRGVPIPTDFSSSPSFARGGNFVSTLLPENLDPQLVERMVAQEGLFGAVQTLTILLSERSPMESMSPTTAGLLYAHSAVPRSNPSVKTPFLADVPKEMIDSDIRITRYLHEKGIVDDENIERAEGMISSAKVSAKYGLTRRQLDTFVDDVLAPFMAVAPANRGALRHINKKMTSIKSADKKTNYSAAYAKLMEMMPTKAEDFYHGRDYGLIASPHCVYPILCEKILPVSDIKGLFSISSKYPSNLEPITDSRGERRMGLKLSRKQAKLISHRVGVPSWRTMFTKILRPGRVSLDESFQAKVDLVRGVKKDDKKYIELIIDAIKAPGIIDKVASNTQRMIFAPNIGGFYPSPPNRWPQQVVYSVMDALLTSLPDIVDIDNPENNYESRVYKLLHQSKDMMANVYIDGKLVPKAEIEKALTDKPTREKLVDKLKGDFPKEFAGLPSLEGDMKNDATKFITFVIDKSAKSTTGIIDPKYGKSIFELLFEAVEIAKGKYNYNIEDDDLTFALILLDYSITKLFDDGTAADAGNERTMSLGGLFGARRAKAFKDMAKNILDTAPAENNAEVAIIVHLGALSSFVDALYNEADTVDNKKASLGKLDQYINVYKAERYEKSLKSIGMKILTDGRDKIQGRLVA